MNLFIDDSSSIIQNINTTVATRITGFSVSNSDRTGSVSGTAIGHFPSVIAHSTGKWYFEVLYVTAGAGSGTAKFRVGIMRKTTSDGQSVGVSGPQIGGTNSIGVASNGDVVANNSGIVNAFSSPTTGQVIGVAWDAGADKIWFSKNNIFFGSPSAGTGGTSFTDGGVDHIAGFSFNSNSGAVMTAAFYSADLTYSPPSGFSAWNP